MPVAGTNLLGQDLMSKLGTGLNNDRGIQISLKLLAAKEEEKILLEVWKREGTRGRLKVIQTHIELKFKRESVKKNTQFFLKAD